MFLLDYPGKGPLNGCVCVCVTVLTLFKKMVNITLDKWPKGCVAVVTEKNATRFPLWSHTYIPHFVQVCSSLESYN